MCHECNCVFYYTGSDPSFTYHAIGREESVPPQPTSHEIGSEDISSEFNDISTVPTVKTDTKSQPVFKTPTQANELTTATTETVFLKLDDSCEMSAVPLLPESTVNSVEKFVFFVGYRRSGHSMIGSVMDAHPDMIIAHEYLLFKKCVAKLEQSNHLFRDKYNLFNTLYANSYFSAQCGWRSNATTSKGYNFDFGFKWQGTYNHLRVIGDKAGGGTMDIIDTTYGRKCFREMSELHVPLVAIHVVRNPFDMIATAALVSKGISDRSSLNGTTVDIPFIKLQKYATKVLSEAGQVVWVTSQAGENLSIVELHSEDYIQNPEAVTRHLCEGLGVDCPEEYVEECARKAYTTISRSRDSIEWPPTVLSFIRAEMKKYPFFNGYTFKDSYRQL